MKWIGLNLVNRRRFLSAGLASLAAGLCTGRAQEGFPRLPDNIRELDSEDPLVYGIWRYVGSLYYFDPIGVHIEPGGSVGFVIGGTSSRTPTITAYHPDNDNHELRIPETAEPFDSGEMTPNRREPVFAVKLEVEGTYDFYSKYNEWVGMVGRIVVGKPGGPGERPWGYGNKQGSKPIPPAVLERAYLMDSERIVREKTVAFPYKNFHLPYPLW